jgi:hypothetical protein
LLLLDFDRPSVSYCNIWQNRAQNGYLISHQSSAKYEDTTKTKFMTGLVDKAIAKVNQNELD